MRILVTGAAGFIGSNFVFYWLKKYPNDKIRVIDALTFAGNIETLRPILPKIEFIEGNITDKTKVREVMEGIDIVVHYAAESHVDRSVIDPLLFWKTNVEGTRTLLEEAHKAGVPRFHHISTDEVYGELSLNSEDKFTENTPYSPKPENPYAVSKAEADMIVRDFYQKTKMHITISNCSNNYGPYQFPEKFVPIAITNLIDGYKVPVHGDGLNTRDWIHTYDHATAIDLILQKGRPGETYLIGSENDQPNRYIAERIVELYGKDENWIRYVPDRHSNDRRYAIDPTKIRTELGWKPVYTRDNFDKGLAETVEWYKKNEDWWRPLLNRKATVTDGNMKTFAFITVDRRIGKIKFSYTGEAPQEKQLEIKKVMEKVSSSRGFRRNEYLKNKLNSRTWFKNSAQEVQKELMDLAENPEVHGFVEDIAGRPDKVGKETQLRLVKLEHSPKDYGIYGISSWFETETEDGKKKIEGYYSWAWGPKSGAKLLLLVKDGESITHLIVLRNDKFPIGDRVFDIVGGFSQQNESVYEFVLRKIKEELGFDASDGVVKVEDIIGLGRIMPDAGMTNNHPLLYSVVLNVLDKEKIPLIKGELYRTGDVLFWPVEKLCDLVNRADDSYFLSALARFSLGGITDIKLG